MKEELAAFQEHLLVALADGTATDSVIADAAAAAPDAAFAHWISSWDADLVALAAVLVQTWAYREPT